jgi:subtilisin family serine protease
MSFLRVRNLVTGFFLLLIVGATAEKAPAGGNWKLVVVECSPQELEKIRTTIGAAIVDARPGRYLISVDSREDVRAIEAIAGKDSVAAADNEEVKLPRSPNRFNSTTAVPASPAPTSGSTSISATGGWTDYYGVRTPLAYAQQPAAGKIALEDAQKVATGRRAVVAVIDTGVDPLHPLLKDVLVSGRNYVSVGSDTSEWKDPIIDQRHRDSLVDQRHRDSLVDQRHRDVVVDQRHRDSLVDQHHQDLLVDQKLVEAMTGQANSEMATDQRQRDLLVDQRHRDVVVDQRHRDSLVDDQWPAGFGHGTMTAGLVHLVAPSALIMPMKAFDANGSGTVWDIVNAIHDSVDMGADIINMSFSGPTHSKVLEKTLSWARSRGVVLVASAGNNNTQAPAYPASYSDVIATAALTLNDQKASFSNYGQHIDMSAPGVALVTAFPGSHWAVVSGTSFSTPLVSGAAALLKELGVDGESARRKIEGSADDLDTPQQFQKKLGEGRVNVLHAVWIGRGK